MERYLMNIEIGSANELNIDSETIAQFYSINWTRKIALSNKEFYEWQFSCAPNKRGINAVLL